MEVFLILLYFSIMLSTGILFFLIIKYLQDKPFGQQFVTDRLSVQSSIVIVILISNLSIAIIVREIFGPFPEWITKSISTVQQFLNLSFLMCLLSMQLAQACNIFFIDRFNILNICFICMHTSC